VIVKIQYISIMTSDEVKARMWEAYKAGVASLLSSDLEPEDIEGARKQYDEWLAENYPKLLEEPAPAPEIYWHEYECRAHHYTPNRTGNCTCDSRMPRDIPKEPEVQVKKSTFRERFDEAVKKFLK
jgi:hypothetical protein